MPKEKPILFSTPMVKAILAGRKTMTRRAVKPQPPSWTDNLNGPEIYTLCKVDKFGDLQPGKEVYGIYDDEGDYGVKCSWEVGDVLWVRETWGYYQPEYVDAPYFVYKADFPIIQDGIRWDEPKWKPSIHMPRSAARIFLKVKSVRVERLQDITEEDAKVEGIRSWTKDGELYKYGHIEPGDRGSTPWQKMPRTAKEAFNKLWDEINLKRGYGWDLNSWCWVIEFERVEA